MAARGRSRKARRRRPKPDEFTSAALEHAHEGLGSPLTGFVGTGEVQRTSSGISVVHLRQTYAGIPVLDGVRSVRLGAEADVIDFTGTTVDVPDDARSMSDYDARAAAHEAFLHLLAAGHVPDHLSFTAAPPDTVARIPGPAKPTVLRKQPLPEPIIASLVMDASRKRPRLVWEVRMGMPDGFGSYLIHVAATGRRERPKVHSVRRTSSHAIRGDVFYFDPSSPAVSVAFPKPRGEYPFAGQSPSSSVWVEVDETVGNNARVIGPSGTPARAIREQVDLDFKPPDAGHPDQWTINAFYWCNVMHDFFWLLGFDEAAGNFQQAHASNAGGGGDELSVVIRNQLISGLAFFQNRPDGTSPTLELGPGLARHTALDADIVIHEFVHGVTSRIIGGKDVHTPLSKQQSLALGEGFSDYYAISIQNYFRRQQGEPEDWVYGRWIANRPTGLRTASYEEYPNRYGFLRRRGMKPHKAGEVWCATLLELNEVLGQGDRDAGDELGWQLVFDSLKLLHPGPSGPHYLHARDAVLTAFRALVSTGVLPDDAELEAEVMDVFRSRGMGPDARSDGARFADAVEGTL